MTKTFWRRQFPLALLAGGLAVTAAAWQTHPADTRATTRTVHTDTVPDRKGKVRDIDDVLEQLEQSKVQVELSLRQVDLSKMQKDMQQAMKELDGARMKADVERALREVDMEKIRTDVNRELSKIDMKQVQADLNREMASLDAQKIKEDVRKSMESVNVDQVRAQVDAALKQVDLEKIQVNLEHLQLDKLQAQMNDLQPQIEHSIADARKGIEKAEQEVRSYKSLIDALDRDGLLDKKGSYTVEYKKGELSVNGKKVAAAKYSQFLDAHKDFTIKKTTDNFSINDGNHEEEEN